MTLWIILAAVAAIIIWLIAVYNSLVTGKNRVNESWSDIEIQLKRRYDLIPNLVETVKGYAKHEKELFEKITEARTAAMTTKSIAGKSAKENALSETLKSIFAVAENYPTLRTSENFQTLQGELTDTENKISASRRFYNGNVRDFNIKIQVFPNNLIAGALKFSQRELFDAPDNEQQPVKVEF